MISEKVNDSYKDLLKYFTDEFSIELLFGQRKPKDIKEEFVMEIFNRVNDIYYVFEKLGKYELYFDKFYPDPVLISEAEVLEYHLHSYLQEIYSLREKMIRLLNVIRKKVILFDIGNPEDVNKVINHLKKQVEKGLTETLKIRDNHVHDKSVRDFNITKAKALKSLSDMKYINQEQFKEKYEPLIMLSKQKYTLQARKNNDELVKMFNFVTCRIGHLLGSYFGHNTDRFSRLF